MAKGICEQTVSNTHTETEWILMVRKEEAPYRHKSGDGELTFASVKNPYKRVANIQKQQTGDNLARTFPPTVQP